MNVIDYTTLLANVNQMINLLEYDSMRSSGKAKMNSQHLESLYSLKDRYEVMVAPKKAAPKTKAATA